MIEITHYCKMRNDPVIIGNNSDGNIITFIFYETGNKWLPVNSEGIFEKVDIMPQGQFLSQYQKEFDVFLSTWKIKRDESVAEEGRMRQVEYQGLHKEISRRDRMYEKLVIWAPPVAPLIIYYFGMLTEDKIYGGAIMVSYIVCLSIVGYLVVQNTRQAVEKLETEVSKVYMARLSETFHPMTILVLVFIHLLIFMGGALGPAFIGGFLNII